MSKLSFEGRVAVVTGAGRGIGRAYALLLGERGAHVVVNDLGGGREGGGTDERPANDVASEIVAAGGVAVADTNDISTKVGASALIDAAVERFGKIDVLVNNAGIFKVASFGDADLENLQKHIDVHLIGTFLTGLAAWPHMVKQKYGRIINTGSAGMFGLPDNVSYAAVKAGIIGLTRQMKIAGEPHGIKVNVIAPAAFTRLAGDESSVSAQSAEVAGMSTALVAPLVAYLAHESCPVSGEVYQAGANRFARIFIASTSGYLHEGPSNPTIEDVVDHWKEINDETDYYVPQTLFSWAAEYMKHMQPSRAS